MRWHRSDRLAVVAEAAVCLGSGLAYSAGSGLGSYLDPDFYPGFGLDFRFVACLGSAAAPGFAADLCSDPDFADSGLVPAFSAVPDAGSGEPGRYRDFGVMRFCSVLWLRHSLQIYKRHCRGRRMSSRLTSCRGSAPLLQAYRRRCVSMNPLCW